MKKHIYCPYTNEHISFDSTNSEHILPLSLGGIDGLEISVDKNFNSTVGSKIDGKLSNDFLILQQRNKLDVRGHSAKKPVTVLKSGKLADEKSPVRVEIDRSSGLNLWCPIEKKPILNTDPKASKVSFFAYLDTTIRLRFVAKTALSAGYYAYGNLFADHVEHEELRFIMNHYGTAEEVELKTIKTCADDQFSDDKSPVLRAFRFVCGIVKQSSCIGLVPSDNRLAIFVGILGQYIGMVNVPCDSSSLSNTGDYTWGRFICVQEGRLIEMSWRQLVNSVSEKINLTKK